MNLSPLISSMEAKEHINKLRRDRGVEKPDVDFATQRLDDALAMWVSSRAGVNITSPITFYRLSDDLYTKPTHFLLELIQNADDNTYEAEDPTIMFDVRDNCLLVGCNEVGFSPEDVDAICDIRRSTKSASRKAVGYIGEKGIGFKSGFKIAETIWISSRFYSFQFVKNNLLGMIMPIWRDFPGQHFKPGLTQFLFEIPCSHDVDDLKDNLRSLQPSILVFLRRLTRIGLKLQSSDGFVWMQRTNLPGLAGEAVEIFVDHPGDMFTERYVVERQQINSLPSDPKRPDITQGEVAVAFPLDGQYKPLIKNCYAYNFLPIRKYEFSVSCTSTILPTQDN